MNGKIDLRWEYDELEKIVVSTKNPYLKACLCVIQGAIDGGDLEKVKDILIWFVKEMLEI